MYVVHVYFQKIFIINIYAVLPSRIKYMYVCTSGHAYYWYLLNTSSIITTIQYDHTKYENYTGIRNN